MSRTPAVLIVDDDTIHQTVTGAMVRKMGFPVFSAYDGLQAIKTFAEHRDSIGCILLDIQMPRMNGIEALRHLRRMSERIEVIVVSGFLDQSNREQLAYLSTWEFLKKPLAFEVLQEKLSECPGLAFSSSAQ